MKAKGTKQHTYRITAIEWLLRDRHHRVLLRKSLSSHPYKPHDLHAAVTCCCGRMPGTSDSRKKRFILSPGFGGWVPGYSVHHGNWHGLPRETAWFPAALVVEWVREAMLHLAAFPFCSFSFWPGPPARRMLLPILKVPSALTQLIVYRGICT